MENVSLIISDVDGVLTDGSVFQLPSGEEVKKFSIYDGGATALLRYTDVRLVVMSGEQSSCIRHRCNKIGVSDFRLGVDNKKQEIQCIIDERGLNDSDVLVIVDFINDLDIISQFNSICPSSAPEFIKDNADAVCDVEGGNGVLWEVACRVLRAQGKFRQSLNAYVSSRIRV